MIDIRGQLRIRITNAIKEAGFIVPQQAVISVTKPPFFHQGDFTTNIALILAKQVGKKPCEVAQDIITHLAHSGDIEKAEASSQGFINMWLKSEVINQWIQEILKDNHFGIEQVMAGKTVLVEFTDPNPFKLFHIGHLMSNAIGESFARLYEAIGAKVIRMNYQGDVGLHVAKAVWGMEKLPEKNSEKRMPKDDALLPEKVAFLGEAYAYGATAYKEMEGAKEEIDAMNKEIFARSNQTVNNLYDVGRAWSLEYFEDIYKKLGTKFDEYFFESEVGGEGKQIVEDHPEIFVHSEGATVFKGEEYGLHTRVFINSLGLPTYEAKELGLNKKKFELYKPDLSIIITGNEVREYFEVLLKAMELLLPEVAQKTRHVPHGMLRLPTGKMSSRTGDVITAESLIAEVMARIEKEGSEEEGENKRSRKDTSSDVAIGAIKYSILKQNPGQDIIFDFEKSLSIHGDSGPYIQYAHARACAIIRKAEEAGMKPEINAAVESVSDLEKHLIEFGYVVESAAKNIDSHILATYLFELAQLFNGYYAKNQVVDEGNKQVSEHRVAVVQATQKVLEKSLQLLGISAPNRM